MADDLITFDENIARDILKMRDEWRRRGTASKRTRRQPIMDDAGGSGALVVFTLSEFAEDIDCDAGSAIATVTYVMSGATVSVGDTILVCDPTGCNLVGSEYLLLGKSGWAAPLVGLSCTSPDPYQTDLPSFGIITLCPSDFSCGG